MSNTVTMETMQADHRQWSEAHRQWRQDIEFWQDEHKNAIARLAEMQKVIQQHGEALADHARAVQQSEKAAAEHDREIADFLAGRGSLPQDVVANEHQEQERSFDQQKGAHERIARHHESVMAQVEALEKVFGAGM